MKKQIILSKIRDYISRHWFKLSLAVLVLLACFRKELSFSLHFNSDKYGQKSEQKKESPDNSTTSNTSTEKEKSTPLSIIGSLFSSDNKKEEFPEIDEATKIAFMKRFAQVAIAERKKYGVPSSIILANAVRQSFAGKRELTMKSNNHFGLPCTFDWNGANEKIGENCFRKYENAWLSFRDHSIFVTSGKFSDLHRLGEKNYKEWAKGLQKLGYPSVSDSLADELNKNY